MAERSRRVVVCGTRFGEHYLASLAGRTDYAIAGIVARGSGRSRALAEHLKIPLFATVDEIPGDVDVACVVVRSAIVGGDGSALALRLLERGIHVLQEHPLHPTDIARLKAAARASGVRYHVHTLYAGMPAGRRFVDYVRRSAEKKAPAFLEITTSLQLLFSSLDIVGRALGTLRPSAVVGPLAITELPATRGPFPFRSLQGVLGTTPFSLKLQTYLDPRDPDHHSLVMHRIAIGGHEGHALLAGSFGPVLFHHSVYAPDYGRDDRAASYLVDPERHAASRYNQTPSAVTFGAARGASLAEAVRDDIPSAIVRALSELTSSGDEPAWQTEDYWQAHGEAWLRIMRAVGQPTPVTLSPPSAPFPDPVRYAEEVVR